MNINGQTINHKTFGCGAVTALTADTITVRFTAGDKKFIYPDAFKDHLVFDNSKMQRDITAQIVEKEEERSRQFQLEQAEHVRTCKLLNFRVMSNSHAVFDISPHNTQEVCETYTVSSGRYLSGSSKGKPRVMERLKPNSACLLTERPIGESEKARRIIGAFMVREDYMGEDSDTGLVEGHPEYRILVPAGDSLLFWELFNQEAIPRWGNTAFKYCSGTAMNRILSNMVQMFENTDQQKSALAFYQYFCKINGLTKRL